MEKIYQKEYPKILVISNNPFSLTSNNGKTLASFFKDFPKDNIAQLYFSSEIPDHILFKNYYRISDEQILKSICSFKKAGGVIVPYKADEKAPSKKLSLYSTIYTILRSNFFRIMRELLWKCNTWKTHELVHWIQEFQPDIVFFCAGDSAFAYDIVSFIVDMTKAKLITYITDDYILPRHTISLLWWFRRSIIMKKMGKAIVQSNLFITISESMRSVYKSIFEKDSVIALNIAESMELLEPINHKQDNKRMDLVYAGGLHFNRHKTLHLLAKAISKYNSSSNHQKAFLSIYSVKKPSKRILKKLNVQNASAYLGGLNSMELRDKLNQADIVVHVEAFDLKSIEATCLSISTKIPEYLSLGKPILAIGPSQVASMQFIDHVAYCIHDKKTLFDDVNRLLEDKTLQEYLTRKSSEMYKTKFDHISLKELTRLMVNLVNES